MALHFVSCIFASRPPTVAAKAQHSEYFNPSNKWNFLPEERSSLEVYKTGDLSTNLSEKVEVVKNEVWKTVDESSFEGLCMIDVMQRLNIDYHFQDEIETFLGKQYANYSSVGSGYGNHIHEIALRFRLSRQHGYFVPEEVFEKFTNKERKIRPELSKNIVGMVDMYEASQLAVAGEDILAEAEKFSGKVLKEKVDCIDSHGDQFIKRTLEHPFHKSLPLFTATKFLGDFHDKNLWLSSFREIAKIDFSLLQCSYHREIGQITKWWTELGLANELVYARNQPLKWYIWSLACFADRSFSEERIELTKPISLIYIIDDIFDVYGTLDELTLFTEAVCRWDITAVEQLPDYMKTCFSVLYNLTNEISSKVFQKHGWNPIHSLQNAWKSLCKAFLVEAKWFGSGKLPGAEEYLNNGTVSSGVQIMLVHTFFLLGEGLTKENVQIIDRNPDIISTPGTILRLWDDLGNAQDENQKGNDGSYVNYLMNEKPEYTREVARERVMSKISDAWKNLNQECLFHKHFHPTFNKASLNLARIVPLMYSYDDEQSLPELEEQFNSLLYDSFL
ncbi:(3S,6E)-nerolidol synthase 1-like [Vigna radiata var. radiata]|uniref:(3S,6E)-nerolidol synthase 1-like n=1 Tax=Vigna radiata var. radiata TaxID=3916 RepID=A0A1S3UKL9_VIGRR|nr:(3S,6E)-nerolidol synthase 1-like [Vigna radiata var. radiata]